MSKHYFQSLEVCRAPHRTHGDYLIAACRSSSLVDPGRTSTLEPLGQRSPAVRTGGSTSMVKVARLPLVLLADLIYICVSLARADVVGRSRILTGFVVRCSADGSSTDVIL